MAILFSQADGSDQHYDTYEEFEKAFVLIKRLNGEKVPQDLLDEVKAKNSDKETRPLQVKIDGNNFESAFRKAVRDVGEELDKLSKDRTPVSDECENPETEPKFEVGDKVRVVSADDGTSVPYHGFRIGSIGEVTDYYENGKLDVYNGTFHQTLLPHHYEKVEPLGKDANGEDLYEGDYITGSEGNDYAKTDDKVVMEIVGAGESFFSEGVNIQVKIVGDWSEYNVNSSEFIKLSDSLDEAKSKFDELNGEEVEDSPTEFEDGDLVRVTESFGDSFGDVAGINSILPVRIDGDDRVLGVGTVLIGDNHDKLRLVCRREDRKDIEL